MGWPLRRWFLAGYAAGPLVAFWLGERPPGPLVLAPVMMWILAPVGLIMGMLWNVRFVFMGWVVGLVVLVVTGQWLEESRTPVPNVPTARAVTAYLFPTSTWNQLIGRLATVTRSQLIGRILLAIAGAALPYIGGLGLGWA